MLFNKIKSTLESINKNKKEKIKTQKIYSINKFLYTFYLIIVIIILIIIISKFSLKYILLSYTLFNIYISYFFLIYYPCERKKIIKYINKVLKDKKEEYKSELENINKENIDMNINKIILKDEDGYDIKIWDISDKNSVLIGKKNEQNDVDVDFSSHEYSHLVSRQHGILNKVDKDWYYEDFNSKNGSGIEKRNGLKEKIKPMSSYKLEKGDILYIGIIKMLLN